MRKLVTLAKIDKLTPIDGADKIETAHVKGWTTVVRKGEFYEGQRVFYFEIDSLLPLDRGYFASFANRGTKELGGKRYHRLRTIKLRGQISQGLIMPYSIIDANPQAQWNETGFPLAKDLDGNKCSPYLDPDTIIDRETDIIENHDGDFSSYFGVVKYEEPEKFDRAGAKLGNFPAWIEKTDEPRIQSIDEDIVEQILADRENFVATEKIDGTSTTIGVRKVNGELEEVVCSRRNAIEENDDNSYWQIAKRPKINTPGELLSPLAYLRNLASQEEGDCSFVLQGELFGDNVQKNPLGIRGRDIAFFNFIKNGTQLSLDEIEQQYPELLNAWVPIHDVKLGSTVAEIITQPDGVKTKVLVSVGGVQIEGFVWRNRSKAYLERNIDLSKIPEEKRELVASSLQPLRLSFKAISNKYLLKHDG